MGMSLEYGVCAQCGGNNPKSLSFCRSCNAALPWAKKSALQTAPPSAPANAAPASPLNQPLQNPSPPPKIGLSDVAWGAMAVQLLGGLIFLAGIFLWCGNRFRFFPTFPFAGLIAIVIGGAIWRAGASME